MKKLLVLAVQIFLLVKSYSLSTTPLSEEYELKVSLIKGTLIRSIIEGTKNLTLARERLKNTVNTAEQSLLQELEHLKQHIKETIVEADNKNINILPCLNQTTVLSDNIETLKICEKQPSFDYMQSEINYLTQKHDAFDKIITDCFGEEFKDSYNTFKIDGAHPCVDEEINEIETRMAIINSISTTLFDDAYQMCMKCVRLQLTKLDNEIISAAREFTSCIDKLMH